MDLQIHNATQMTDQLPDLQIPDQSSDKKGLSSLKWLWVVMILLLVLLLGGMFVFSYVSNRHTAYAPTKTPAPLQSSGVPQATKTIDLAPNVPANQKTIITIENSDSSLEKIILPTTQVTGYMRSLPQGVRVISQSPAGQ